MIKKSFSLLLITAVGLNSLIAIPSYAEDSTQYSSNTDVFSSFALGKGVNVERISENEYQVRDGDYLGFISIVDDDMERIVTVRDEKTNEENFIKLDKSSGLVFSSFTDSTIKVEAVDDMNNILTDTSLFSSTKPPHNPMISYETEYISYARILQVTGAITDTGQLVGAILFFVPNCSFAGGAISAISTIIEKGLMKKIPNDSYHGIKLSIKKKKYYRKRLGNWGVHRITHTVTDVTTY